MIWSLRTAALAGALGLIGLGGVAAAAPASASCVFPPLISSPRFTGIVTKVENLGRTATVVTDDGRTVIVRGGDAVEPDAATSVDRTYQVGVRYEFHPINGASPYTDNACTATRPLPATTRRPGRGPETDASPGHRRPTALWLATAAIVVLVAAGGSRLVLRRRVRPAPSS